VDDDLLNLEFRILLLDEGIKEARIKLEQLAVDIEHVVGKYAMTEDENYYWKAD
jgi:hypothetical protein